MAIDTEAKRRGKVPPLWVLPLADGTIGQGDRQHKGLKYPGILATAAAAAPATVVIGLDVTEAFRNILRLEHVLTDNNRLQAQQTVRDLVEDVIYVGKTQRIRIPDNAKGKPLIHISYSDVEREYLLSGELDSTRSLVQVVVFHKNRKWMYTIWDGVRQIFTSLVATVPTSDGDIFIGGCTLESESEISPDELISGSEIYDFSYQGFFRVTHSIISPSGVS